MSAWKASVLFVLLYVTLDFADPMTPGALCFNPDDSVEVVQMRPVDLTNMGAALVPSVPTSAVDPTRDSDARRPWVRSSTTRRPAVVARAQIAASDSVSASEDH